jgi:hypothetical protein
MQKVKFKIAPLFANQLPVATINHESRGVIPCGTLSRLIILPPHHFFSGFGLALSVQNGTKTKCFACPKLANQPLPSGRTGRSSQNLPNHAH